MKKHNIDYNIKSNTIKLVTPEGSTTILTRSQAIDLAKKDNKNLVEFSSNQGTSICKIMNYGGFQYKLEKQKKENKNKSKVQNTIKEITFKMRIEENDLNIRLKHARNFLTKGNQVKICLKMFRSALSNPEAFSKAMSTLSTAIERLSDISKIKSDGRSKHGRDQFVLLMPNNKK